MSRGARQIYEDLGEFGKAVKKLKKAVDDPSPLAMASLNQIECKAVYDALRDFAAREARR